MSGDAFRLSCVMVLSHRSFVKLSEQYIDRPKIRWSSEKKADGLITVILAGTALTEPETSVFMTEMVEFVGGMSQLKIEKLGESPDLATLPAAPLSQGDAEKRATLHALLDTPIKDVRWVTEGVHPTAQTRIVNSLLNHFWGYAPTLGRLVLQKESISFLNMSRRGVVFKAMTDKLAELGLRLGMSPAELDGWVPLEERDGAQA
jgi:hypothetical protein